MKKLLVAVLAFALFAPAFAVENVQVTGDIQTIGISVEDPAGDFGTPYKGVRNRVILGLGADLVDDVYAKVTFAHENMFGDYTTASGEPLVGENLDDIWTRTYVSEAFIKISNIFDAVELKVGRQYYGDEKSSVLYFGPTYGYADPVVTEFGTGIFGGNPLPSYLSVDGATAAYRGDNLTLTAAYLVLSDDLASINGFNRSQQASLSGLDLGVKVNENINADAYIYDVKGVSAGWIENFGFWGVKPTIEYEHFKLGVDFARNYGAGNDKGWQVKADLALPIGTEETSVTPRVTYYKSEKNFQAFGNYRPGLMFGTIIGGGLNNYIADANFGGGVLSNWEIVNAGLCMKFAGLEKWGFALDFYTGESSNGTFMGTSKFLGNSWEAKVVYNVNQYVALNATGALLTNKGHSWKHSISAVQLGLNVKF